MRARDERIDERLGDFVENRPQYLVQQFIRKLVMELELDLAADRTERFESPVAVKVFERPLFERDPHFQRGLFLIDGAELGFHPVEVDLQGGVGQMFRALVDLGATTPRQKLRVVFAVIDQREHRLRRTIDQNLLVYRRHWQKPKPLLGIIGRLYRNA